MADYKGVFLLLRLLCGLPLNLGTRCVSFAPPTQAKAAHKQKQAAVSLLVLHRSHAPCFENFLQVGLGHRAFRAG